MITKEDFQKEAARRIERAKDEIGKFQSEIYRSPIGALRWPSDALRAAATLSVWQDMFNIDPATALTMARRYAMEKIEPSSSPSHDEFEEYKRRQWADLHDFIEAGSRRP